MPKHPIYLNSFSNAAADAIQNIGRYAEDPGYRNDNTYYWAELSSWHLARLGIPGRPDRAPNAAENAGMRKIPALRRELRGWLVNQLRAGRRPDDPALMRETTRRFANGIKNDVEMTAAIAFMKEQLGTADMPAQPISPSFNDLWNRSRNIETRSPDERCQTILDVNRLADAMRAEAQHAAGAPEALPENEYDRVRAEDMLAYLDHYDSPELPLDPPAVRDHVYGPAPDLSGVI